MTKFQKNNTMATRHGFYYDLFFPCEQCTHKKNCKDYGIYVYKGIKSCNEERVFFEETIKTVQEEFQLDQKDIFQLPLMVMNIIKLKRMHRYQAQKGPIGHTFMFNPKTGKEHKMDTSNPLNKDSYYAEKALLTFFDSLRISRQSRDAKEGVDVLKRMMDAGIKKNIDK